MCCAHTNSHPTPAGGRLNLLLSYGGWRDECWADQLPRLLEPMGVQTVRATTAKDAMRLVQTHTVHIAVVDLALPLDLAAQSDPSPASEEAGPRVLDLLNRLDAPPPTLVIKRRKSRRDDIRELATALHAGAFAVLEPPVQLETILETMRRVLRRYYSDRWPGISLS